MTIDCSSCLTPFAPVGALPSGRSRCLPRGAAGVRRLLPDITQRTLTLQLRELEADGVVHREVYAEAPPRVEYSLTPFGWSLEPILLLMRDWGDQYASKIEAAKGGAAGMPDLSRLA